MPCSANCKLRPFCNGVVIMKKPSNNPNGRPATINARRRCVMLDEATWQAAIKLGNGNASAGIRWAVGEVGK